MNTTDNSRFRYSRDISLKIEIVLESKINPGVLFSLPPTAFQNPHIVEFLIEAIGHERNMRKFLFALFITDLQPPLSSADSEPRH